MKVSICIWRILLNRMPSRDNLIKRNIQLVEEDTLCLACRVEAKSIAHVLFRCKEAQKVWKTCFWWFDVAFVLPGTPRLHFYHYLCYLGTLLVERWKVLWCAVVWCIWKYRNASLHKNQVFDSNKVIQDVLYFSWA